MDDNTSELKASWQARQEAFGSTKRSVLSKNLPDFMNNSLHARHVQFVFDQLTEGSSNILDLGCGYGRISAEIKKAYPECTIQGVELCDEFAEQFRREIGACASGTIQNYQPTRKFDVILFITVLMYVEPGKVVENLDKYWRALNPGGRFICIESCGNMFVRLRASTNNEKLSPTGGGLVHYFGEGELAALLSNLTDSRVLRHKKFGIFPFANLPRLHDGFSVEKGSS